MYKRHYLHEVANMQRIGRGVEANITGRHFFLKLLFCSGGDVVHHATPPKFLYKIVSHVLKSRGKDSLQLSAFKLKKAFRKVEKYI
jgi:hypothetical protein